MSRKGHKRKLGFEGGQMKLVRRIPKRGFKNPARKMLLAVNVSMLARFDDGAVVDSAALKAAGLAKGAFDGVKLLGTGELNKRLTVKANAFSEVAKTKIEAAGGTCEVVKS